MEITQIEIDFAPYLETAIAYPKAAEIVSLLNLLEQSIEAKGLHEQLCEAGSAIEALSEVLAAKCNLMLDGWDAKWNLREPVVDFDKFPGLLVEPCIDLGLLLEPQLERFYPENRESATRCGSAVKEATPEQMLEALPSLEQIQAIAHSENIEEWIEVVSTLCIQPVSLEALIQNSGLSVVQVWIALLFGNFSIERSGDFYEGELLIWKQI